jgi:hypothetical protein
MKGQRMKASLGLAKLLAGAICGVILFVIFVIVTDPSILYCFNAGRGLACLPLFFGK